MPKISVILPTHNGARFLARAIASVQTQTFADFELIVIIDGSADNSGEIARLSGIKDPRIKVISLPNNRGIQYALAQGLKTAQGEYIARIDDDDEWCDKTKLQRQLDYCMEHEDCVLVGTGLIVADEQGSELYRFLNPQTDAEIRSTILYRNCFSHSTVLFKKSAAMKFGGYAESETTKHVEDYDLWLKLGTIGTFANLPEYSVRLTARSGSISGKHKLLQFKNQLAITKGYTAYTQHRAKSYLRLIAYALFGKLIPPSFIKFYKS